MSLNDLTASKLRNAINISLFSLFQWGEGPFTNSERNKDENNAYYQQVYVLCKWTEIISLATCLYIIVHYTILQYIYDSMCLGSNWNLHYNKHIILATFLHLFLHTLLSNNITVWINKSFNFHTFIMVLEKRFFQLTRVSTYKWWIVNMLFERRRIRILKCILFIPV